MILILVLDRYHLGDPLFARQLGRDLAAHSGPVILVHDSAEDGERALEGQGRDAVRRAGRLVTGNEFERALVERALRELNRRLAGDLNEEGVPVVRVTGTDRGLLRAVGDGVEARAGWLATVADRGAVPLVGAIVATEAGAVEVDAASAAAAIAGALEIEGRDATLLFLTTDRRAGLYDAETAIARIETLSEGARVADAEGVRRVAGLAPVRVTSAAALRGAGPPAGTDVGAGARRGAGVDRGIG